MIKRATTWQNQQSDCAPSEDSDQPGHPPSLIRVFAVRMKKTWVLSYPLSAQRRLWSDWADAQADLSLRWAHTHFVGFVMSWLKNWFKLNILVCSLVELWYEPAHVKRVLIVEQWRLSPEPSVYAHTIQETRGSFRQRARDLAPLNSCAFAFEPPHDKTNKMTMHTVKTDQPGSLPSLISLRYPHEECLGP